MDAARRETMKPNRQVLERPIWNWFGELRSPTRQG